MCTCVNESVCVHIWTYSFPVVESVENMFHSSWIVIIYIFRMFRFNTCRRNHLATCAAYAQNIFVVNFSLSSWTLTQSLLVSKIQNRETHKNTELQSEICNNEQRFPKKQKFQNANCNCTCPSVYVCWLCVHLCACALILKETTKDTNCDDDADDRETDDLLFTFWHRETGTWNLSTLNICSEWLFLLFRFFFPYCRAQRRFHQEIIGIHVSAHAHTSNS